ncbi:hypothetical protein LTR97_009762 [Elasticomyces elasticus]|uniref:C2H2-type domain-containing protein n=1 Tax=Elasticomyces elasticus TaxID=574655 RepID=A0AAN7ZRU3_9PEZI|nr:hypothetical protein LTR97_009762 [Elasticomyces elasticus]
MDAQAEIYSSQTQRSSNMQPTIRPATVQMVRHPVFAKLGFDVLYCPGFHFINTHSYRPVSCYVCQTVFADKDAVLAHIHIHHGQPPSELCCCRGCREIYSARTTETINVSEFAAFEEHIVDHKGGPTSSQIISENSDVSEHNLPDFMGKLEPGTFCNSGNKRSWKVARLRNPQDMTDHNDNPIISASTGNRLREVPFLPPHIPSDIPGWRLLYYERKAAEQGINLTLDDIRDRMALPKKSRALSMRLQRQREGMGCLPLYAKEATTFACKQNMQTLEDLIIFQAKLNTVWQPAHISSTGPWKVVQSAETKIDGQLRRTIEEGASYIVEEMYGLSDRVRDISDTMIFLDCLIIGAGEEPSTETRARMWHMTNEEEFEDWRGCMKRGPSMADVTISLEEALMGLPSWEEIMKASLGDVDLLF